MSLTTVSFFNDKGLVVSFIRTQHGHVRMERTVANTKSVAVTHLSSGAANDEIRRLCQSEGWQVGSWELAHAEEQFWASWQRFERPEHLAAPSPAATPSRWPKQCQVQ